MAKRGRLTACRFARTAEAWESWEVAIERVAAINHDRVLVVFLFDAKSKRGGVPVVDRFASVVTVRDRKVARSETYSSPEQALQASGRER